jgi:hypothetical protein
MSLDVHSLSPAERITTRQLDSASFVAPQQIKFAQLPVDRKSANSPETASILMSADLRRYRSDARKGKA